MKIIFCFSCQNVSVLFSTWIGQFNQLAQNIKQYEEKGTVNHSSNYHFIHCVWTPKFSMAKPIPVSFCQLFLLPLMKTQSAWQQMGANFLPRATHCFYCEEATVRAAGRKPIKSARRSVACATRHMHAPFPHCITRWQKAGVTIGSFSPKPGCT